MNEQTPPLPPQLYDVPNPDNVLHIYTVYFNPSDHPGKYVVRLFFNDKPTDMFWVNDTIEAARAPIPRGLTRLPRQTNDDSVIIETWL